MTRAADRTAPAHSPSFWSRFSTSRRGPAPPLCYHPGGAVRQGGQEVADALWEQEAQVGTEGEKMQCLKDTGLMPAPWTLPMDLAQSIPRAERQAGLPHWLAPTSFRYTPHLPV